MKLDYPNGKDKVVSIILLGLAVLLAVLISVKVTGFVTTSARAESLVKSAAAQGQPDVEQMEKHLADSKAVANGLKKKNLFAPPPPRQHPVKEVAGILGSEALINGRWYKVGDKIADARVVTVEATQVRIVWDGKEKVFAPMGATGAAPPGGSRPGRPDRRGAAGAGPGRREGAAMVVVGPGTGRSGRGRFGSLSDEERERMRQRFENMSEQERQEFRERMRERWGRGRQ